MYTYQIPRKDAMFRPANHHLVNLVSPPVWHGADCERLNQQQSTTTCWILYPRHLQTFLPPKDWIQYHQSSHNRKLVSGCRCLGISWFTAAVLRPSDLALARKCWHMALQFCWTPERWWFNLPDSARFWDPFLRAQGPGRTSEWSVSVFSVGLTCLVYWGPRHLYVHMYSRKNMGKRALGWKHLPF